MLRKPGFYACILILLFLGLIPLRSFAMHSSSMAMLSSELETIAQIKGCPTLPVEKILTEALSEALVVDYLLQGTCVAFDARSQDNLWLRIAATERQVSIPGWVPAASILLEQQIEQLVVVQTPLSTVNAVAAENTITGCVILANSLRVRTGPSTGYFTIGALLKDECIKLNGRNAENTWARFEKGWVSSFYLKVNGKLRTLPVVKAGLPEFAEP